MIDVTKCFGCRKGVLLFIKENDAYFHVDLFATPEAGEEYKCENSDTIGEFLIKREGKGTYVPNEELKDLFWNQSMWWEDIIDLAHDIFESDKKVGEFFNEETDGILNWNLSNEDIENKLLN